MARRKRESGALKKFGKRVDALITIDPVLDFGNGLTVPALQTKRVTLETKLKDYNAALTAADSLLNELEKLESEAADLTERALAAVGGRYGTDSDEYEKAGGTRKSERKRPVRKAQPART